MSQINKICSKCNKQFTSVYLLNRHINRTISCDVVLQCNRCNTIFTTSAKLATHIKRKTPCDIFTIKISDKLALVNAKEQSEINILNQKMIIRQQLVRDAEQLANQISEKLIIKDKIKAEEKRKLAEYKAETAFKLQEMKNNSKYNTTKILNDRAEIEKQRLALDKKAEDEHEYEIMHKMAFEASKYTKNFFTSAGLDTIFRDTCHGFTEEDCIVKFTNAKTCTDIACDLIKVILNDGNPKNKNLFYNSRIGLFSAIVNKTINNVCHVTVSKHTYAQVFDTLHDVVEYCYNRYNGSEIALYGYKCRSIMAKNAIADKFARFDVERASFILVSTYNKKCLNNTIKVICDKVPTDVILYKNKNQLQPLQSLQISEKIISCQLQSTIMNNTNIYLAGLSLGKVQGAQY